MHFAMLGPLEVTDGDRRVDIGAARQRAVLAVLLVRLNQVVSFDSLIDELWGDAPPGAASASLQAYVSRLRRALEPDRPARAPAQVLVTEPPGYALRLDPDQVDAYRFERLTGEGRARLASADPHGAVVVLDEALSLWRGQALADFAFEPFATVTVGRLDELRAAAEEDRIEARLGAGDHAGAAVALPPLIAEHPLRERLRGQLMVALYRCGRQAEALRAYDDARRLLVDELGIDPGRDLQLLHRRLLDHDTALDVVAPQRATTTATTDPLPADRQPSGTRDLPAKPFVGRGPALEVLDRAWQGALAGRARFVVIAGEPGIGKTTLAESLVARAEASGAAVAWGRCHDDEGALPLWPWAQVVRALTPASEIPGDRRPILAALLPELGEPEAPVDADAARFRLYDAVRDSLERAAASRPVVIVLDDLHWADASSLRLLRFLMVEIKDARLLVLATLRDTEGETDGLLAATLGDLARTQGAERIVLDGLTEPDVAELVRMTTGVPGEHAEALAPELFRRADGNPFFVTELVRLLDSERRVRPGETMTEIPAAVGDVVRNRVRRLPEDSQGLLRVAAAIGREFDLDVLGLAAGLDDDDLLDALEPAIVTRIVSQSGPNGYRFSHALVRDALYLDIPPTRRWRLHGGIGDAIESLHAADLGPASGELAFHFVRSAGVGRAERAFRYACMAAEQAARRLSFDEAAAHWREAIDLLDRGGGAPGPAEQSRLLLQLATALRHAGDLTASVAAQDEALAVAELSGDLDALARAALSYGRVGLWQRREYATVDPRVIGALERLLRVLPGADDPERARLLAGLAVALYYSEEHRDRVGALAAEALAMARRMGDRALIARVFDQVHVMLDGDEQLRTLAQLSASGVEDGAIVVDPAGQARLARLRLALGDASTLESDADEALRAGEELCDPALRQFAGWLRTTVAFLRGRLDEVEPLAARARALHDQLGFWGGAELYGFNLILLRREQGRLDEIARFAEVLRRSNYPSVAKVRGLFALERGDLDEVRAVLGDGDPIPRARDFIWLTEMALLAELAAAAGLPCAEEVYELLLPSSDQVVTMSAYGCLGAVSHYLGLIAAGLGRTGDAGAHFEAAVALNDKIGAVPWGVRSRYHLAGVVEPVDPQRAHGLLFEASHTASAHGLVAMGRRLDDSLAARAGASRGPARP